MHFSLHGVASKTLVSVGHFGQLLQVVAQQWESFGSSMTGQPPSGNAGKQDSKKVANAVHAVVRSNLLHPQSTQGSSAAYGHFETSFLHYYRTSFPTQ